MSRFLTALSLPALLFAVSHAAPAPKEPPQKPYLTTTKGTTLVYQYTTTDGQGLLVESEVTNVVTAVAKTDAGTVVTLSEKMEGSEYGGTDTFLISEKGLFTTGTSMTGPDIQGERSWKIDPPACLLRLPHKDGAQWEYNCPSQPGGLMGGKATKTAHGPEEVIVPAGKYTAIRVEYRGMKHGQEETATFWYAPEVGLVKMVCAGAVQELKSLTPEQ
jgi:hypothetical protein